MMMMYDHEDFLIELDKRNGQDDVYGHKVHDMGLNTAIRVNFVYDYHSDPHEDLRTYEEYLKDFENPTLEDMDNCEKWAEEDKDRLHSYHRGDWWYFGIEVVPYVNGIKLDGDSCFGYRSDDEHYTNEVVQEMIDGVMSTLPKEIYLRMTDYQQKVINLNAVLFLYKEKGKSEGQISPEEINAIVQDAKAISPSIDLKDMSVEE
jgi:hypothetical protein